MELRDIRKEIDALDEEMAKLFVRRMDCADCVAEAKRGTGKAVLDPGREREILAKVAERGPAALLHPDFDFARAPAGAACG